MKLYTSIVFYIFSVYVVFNAKSFIRKKHKLFKFKTVHCRKNPAIETIGPLKPDLLPTEPSTAPKNSVGTVIGPPKPDSSMAEPSSASKKSVEIAITPPNKSESSTAEPSTASEKPVETTITPPKSDSSTAEHSTASEIPVEIGSTYFDESDSSTTEPSTASEIPVETTITPPKSDTSTAELSTAPEKPVETTITPPMSDSSTAELSTTTKKPVGTTTRAKPDSSTADPLILSNTSATTNEPSAAYCFSDHNHTISKNSNPNIINDAMTRAIFESTFQSIETELFNIPRDIFLCSLYAEYEAETLLFFGSRNNMKLSLGNKLSISPEFSKIDLLRHYYNREKIDQERKKKGDESGAYEYNCATHLWIDKRYKLRECMLDLLGNKLENIDFSDHPLDLMDDLIKNETEDRMDVSSTDVDLADSNFLLITYIYFQGRWATPFRTINIRTHPFYGSETTDTTFMDFTGNFHYVESKQLGVQILQLPYEGGEISMFILLPLKFNSMNTTGSLRELNDKLANDALASSELKKYLTGVRWVAKCQVSLPRFETSFWSENKFERNQTDLRDFYDSDEDNNAAGIVHVYTELNVNENVAKRPTANLIPNTDEHVNFTANHPFLFIICDVTRTQILFAGIYINPIDSGDSS